VDLTKHVVGLDVSMSPVPPAFDDSGIVSMDNDVAGCLREKIENVDEEIETNGLSPTNVALGALHALPIWVESSSIPPCTDDNCNTHTRADQRKLTCQISHCPCIL
jgi:hypothetical protein